MATIEEKYQFTTAEESVIHKDWAAGSSKQITNREFVIKCTKIGGDNIYTATYGDVTYPPALWKIIDEPIVNALDHLIRCLGTSAPVTCIKVKIDATGRIQIYNNGPGVEVVIHKTATEKLGRTMWVPTFIFGTLFQGSNRVQAEDSIIGGTNGLGAKLTKCFSVDFIVETVRDGMYFMQRWVKGVENEPIVIDLTQPHKIPLDRTIPHTTLSFIPDYTGIFGYPNIDSTLIQSLTDIIRTRTFFAAAYGHFSTVKKQPLEVWFNDEKLPIKSVSDIAAILFPNQPLHQCIINPTIAPSRANYKYAWEVCVVIADTAGIDTPAMSIVNGVVVRDGKHHKYVMEMLAEGVRERIAKAIKDQNLNFSSALVSRNVFLIMNTKIPKPSWTGQRKDVLDIDVRKLAGYVFEPKFITQIADKLQDRILASVFMTPAANGKKKNKNVDFDQYKPAAKLGSKRRIKPGLIVIEGKSALSQVCMGIAHHLGWDNWGALALGGVIMNPRTKCTVVDTENGQYVKKTQKLANNIFMNMLSDITGLNTSYKYDPKSPTFKNEMAELQYGFIASCVDQDLDGKGNILGILLSTFELFWPNLINAGYLKWFCTPIIRAYPKRGGKVMEFYSVHEFEEWAKTVNIDDYDVKYYKGIGTHSRDETIQMFSTFHQNLYTYYLDERSHELFNIYFGDQPDLRKVELAKPSRIADTNIIALQSQTKTISCSDHLEYETNLYQKDNLERKLDSEIDGQNQGGRMILNGLIKALTGDKAMKVAQLAGYISENENYHHGEACLNDSIAGRGFIAVGGRQLPLIIPQSNFGSRLGGGDDAAAPRYIYAKLNKQITAILYPPIDYWTLPFNFDEGKRGEPKYFVPIVPTVLLESKELPAHGWKLKLWARDVFKVIENVRRMIRLGDTVSLLPMPPTRYAGAPYEWTGTFKTIRGEPWSFGRYTYNAAKNTINITELPLRVWNEQYINMLKKKARSENEKIISSVAGIVDASDDIKINISIKLKPGAKDILDSMNDSVWADGVEEYFQLRCRMDSHINLMGRNGEVIMYKNYEDVMYNWFAVRKEFYAKRIDRQRALIILNIRRLENIIRYIGECDGYNLARKKKAVMESILTGANYDKLCISKLNNPKFTPTAEFDNVILRGPKANYDYLLGLSDLQKTEEVLDEFKQELTNTQRDLINLNEMAARGRFPGAEIWENELDRLEAKIREGQKTFWKYGDVNKYKF